MSGGSFDYLFAKEADLLLSSDRGLAEMAEALSQLGYAEDAAQETYEAVLIIRQTAMRLRMIRTRLAPVWKAMEWRCSGDGSDADLKAALVAYRGAGG